jgi:hypothetical protein
MKKLFLITLTLGSIVAHANTAFEFELEHSRSLLIESKNYEAKHVNQDLTVSIVKPKFSNPNGDGSLFLSENSDKNGACKLYGLASYVAKSMLIYNAGSGSNVVIDASSKFSAFGSNVSGFAIGTITCNTAENKPIPVSDNLSGRFINDDQSVTIKTPKFMMNGENLYFSENSEKNGVCKLYGLTSYIANSMLIYNARSGRNVVTDASSKFSEFGSNVSGYAIGSLMCR